MDSKRRNSSLNPCPPSPLPNLPSSSSIFRDISNFKTPQNSVRAPNFQASPQFFTASKKTPFSSSNRLFKSSALKSKAASRLRAFELEQAKSARKAQSEKEKSQKSLARSLTVWLNFLFENPSSCGCDPASFTGEIDGFGLSSGARTKEVLTNNGKRESGPEHRVGTDGPWRVAKRQRDLLWRMEVCDEVGRGDFSSSKFSGLRISLQEICSFEDLKDRMRMYLNLGNCKDVLETMSQITKNIDEGRLRMRASCPIVSDVAIKEKAMGVLMCYNTIWLRIGLYIILGGDLLLPNGDVSYEHENAFLRMILEKQFFSHAGLAKAHAYNKQVEGLYRPGYYEKLGNVILKRVLLLVIILDRIKLQTSLPLKYGIDGLDGGSPRLFSIKSNIRSSRQVIVDFLSSDVMHGEGNILTHLMIVGYKVTYQQNPLIEYDFKVTDLFEDLRDGIRFCRATELLKHDPSILMKVVVPSDTQKKSLVNCGIALQYLKQAGVPLDDQDGTEIIVEDVVNGDKDLTVSLLWNMFVHLQLPLLISRALLLEEISNIQGVVKDDLSNQTLLDLLLSWIKAICETYELKIESHSSLLDGKALWCLLDYYFRKEHDCSCSFKDPNETKKEISIMSAIEYTDAVHNFILSQKLTSLLGNFPEVLQVSDIIEHNGACNGQSVMVLLVFLSVQLLVKRNMDKLNFHKLLGFGCQIPNRRLSTEWNSEPDPTRGFKAIMAWWQGMAQQNGKCSLKPTALSAQCFSTDSSSVQRENAATIIQSHYRGLMARRNFKRVTNAALLLQAVALTWLTVRREAFVIEPRARTGGKHSKQFAMYVAFMTDKHRYINLKKSVRVIQQATRAWLAQRHCKERIISNKMHDSELTNATTVIQSCIRGWIVRSVCSQRVVSLQEKHLVMSEEGRLERLRTRAAIIIQHCWKDYIFNKHMHFQHSAATKIQSYYHGWLMRKDFACKKKAARTIQGILRCSRSRRDFKILREEHLSAIIIQSHVRGWMARKRADREKILIIRMQSCCRGYLRRKEIVNQKNSAIKIQSAIRSMNCSRWFHSLRHAAIDVQRFVRGENTRKWLLGDSCCRKLSKQGRHGHELKIFLQSVVKLQRWWRFVLQIRVKTNSAVVIQSAIRCMNCHHAFHSLCHAAIDIQRFVRGENTRKLLLGNSFCRTLSKQGPQGHELKILQQSAVKLQRWWRSVLQNRVRTNSVVVIQSHYRGWRARKMTRAEKQHVVMIQSYWKGYLARKDSRGQLRDLRLRMQESAANVDDSARLINRLVAAVSELLNMRSVSGILHTCSTLNMATELSQKCCEEIVAAGAIGTLLKLIRSVSRSIPDQEVLKHALSTLRNLARYPHLTKVLVNTHGCIETVLLEFLRNKEEGYFIASEMLKRMCVCENGAEAIRKSPALVKRLYNIADELARKAGTDKRNARDLAARQNAERRLREVVELLKIISKV